MLGVFATFRPFEFVWKGASAGAAVFVNVDNRTHISSETLKTLLGFKGTPTAC